MSTLCPCSNVNLCTHCLLLPPGALRNLAAVDASRTEMASDPSVAIVLVAPLAHLPPSAASSAASSFSSGPGAQRGSTRAPAAGSGSINRGLLQHVMGATGSPLVMLDVQIGECLGVESLWLLQHLHG
jgi:hypothetical protein